MSLEQLPFGYGNEFPAFLTWRGGIDLGIIDLMRPLHDKGVRSEALSDILLELHSKAYTKSYFRREKLIERDTALDPGSLSPQKGLFSEFSDKEKYDGVVPTGKYLRHVYKLYHACIKGFMDKEVKKRGAKRLHWDASFKEPTKHLAQYRGQKLFNALITATNEHGEIRLQFHTVSDSHDQMIAPIQAFLKTANEYGHDHPILLTTDKPCGDKRFFRAH
eukprot:scaffold183316_cov56-Attheya_sp.AAC.3